MECVEQGVDDAVGVIRLDTPEGDQLGALINFGCHALCSTDRYGHITADYPRYVADLFRQVAGVPVVFTQGGLGDVVPIERQGAGRAPRGRSVGAAALYAFEQLKPAATPPLGLLARRVEIPARVVEAESEDARTSLRDSHARYRAYLHEWYRRHPTIAYPIKLVTLGDVAVLQLAGEAFHETVLAIKGASPFAHTVVVSRATREVGYVPPRRPSSQGGMEVSLTGIAPASEPLIRAAAVDLLRAGPPRRAGVADPGGPGGGLSAVSPGDADDLLQKSLRVAAPPEAVFALLTDPDGLGRWLTPVASLEPVPGGEVELVFPNQNGTLSVIRGQVTEVVRPERIAYTWHNPAWDFPPLHVRFDLRPDGGGTRVHLSQWGFAGQPLERAIHDKRESESFRPTVDVDAFEGRRFSPGVSPDAPGLARDDRAET